MRRRVSAELNEHEPGRVKRQMEVKLKIFWITVQSDLQTPGEAEQQEPMSVVASDVSEAASLALRKIQMEVREKHNALQLSVVNFAIRISVGPTVDAMPNTSDALVWA